MDLFSYLRALPVQCLFNKDIHSAILITATLTLLCGTAVGMAICQNRKNKVARKETGGGGHMAEQELDQVYQNPCKRAWRCAALVAATVLLACAVSLPALIQLRTEAVRRGCPEENLGNYTVWSLIANTQLSRPEDTLPDDLRGSVIIYYEFGNNYYNDIANDLKAATVREHVYWVDVNSEQGRRMMDKYTSRKVPIAFYISTMKEDYHSFISICGTNYDGSAFLETDLLNSLYALQDAGK